MDTQYRTFNPVKACHSRFCTQSLGANLIKKVGNQIWVRCNTQIPGGTIQSIWYPIEELVFVDSFTLFGEKVKGENV